ncbi:MAG: ATP-binding protein [Bacteroidetes bacterium]|nr:ATP-binding protein [Bacteroidota bacterium]
MEEIIEELTSIDVLLRKCGTLNVAIQKAKPRLERAKISKLFPKDLESPLQQILFCHFLRMSLRVKEVEETGGWLFFVTNHYDLRKHESIALIEIADKMLKDGYLEMKGSATKRGRNIYEPLVVPQSILTELVNGRPIKPGYSYKCNSIRQLIKKVRELLRKARMGRMSEDDLIYYTQKIISKNEQNRLVKAFSEIVEPAVEIENIAYEFLITVLILQKGIDSSNFTLEELTGNILEDFEEENFYLIPILSAFEDGKHPLLVGGYVQRERSSLVSKTKSYEVTNKGIEAFLGSEATSLMNQVNDEGLIYPDLQVVEKELFFDGELKEELLSIERLFVPGKFETLQSRFKEKFKNRGGVSILLGGGPGTGKTEFVLQLAKKTGRAIMRVDLSETKSMWYGQSEQLTKGIFNQYRVHCRKQKLTPILFINEADGLLGKRLTVERTIDQTSNTIQNILLEEIESLEGILIITTNLVENLDKAFDRRFLMKIKFQLPGKDIRERLWRKHLDDLVELQGIDFEKLAEREMTPAQIENVALRIATVTMMGEPIDEGRVEEFCMKELGISYGKKIGFLLSKS